jgi:hypothetical protein
LLVMLRLRDGFSEVAVPGGRFWKRYSFLC